MTGAVPAHIETYVEVLGEELAIEFFLMFGGSEQYFSSSPKRSMMLELTGLNKLTMLSERLGCGHVRVPIPKPWIAEWLLGHGHSKAEIARRLHVDQRTVDRWVAKARNSAQLRFFD